MFLKGAIRLKNGQGRFFKKDCPWVFSNELVRIDTKLPPGSWVILEDSTGQSLGYGFFNPHSLIAFRIFERTAFQSEEHTKQIFFQRLDFAYKLRTQMYGNLWIQGIMGRHSFRLVFGESDGMPGLILDLYESSQNQGVGSAIAVIQCHAAGADTFIPWVQQWLESKLAIHCGVIRNDIDVRKKEHVDVEVSTWGQLPSDVFVLEGEVRFFVDPVKGQKTGYFYDHRDNRAEFARRMSQVGGTFLDCFSYVGSWGLQALNKNPQAKLVAIDISKEALEDLLRNAKENGLENQVEIVRLDFFKNSDDLRGQKFNAIVVDPPSLITSAKSLNQGKHAHTACFSNALSLLSLGGMISFSSCSYHLLWEDFIECIGKAGHSQSRLLQYTFFGSQAADHPVLSSLLETQYLKCIIANV